MVKEGKFDRRFFLATSHDPKLLFSLLNEWNCIQRTYDFKGVIPNVDQVDRRNNEQGRITRLLDANCAGLLSLHLLANQTVKYICIYIHTYTHIYFFLCPLLYMCIYISQTLATRVA